jgi:hypothetical protein
MPPPLPPLLAPGGEAALAERLVDRLGWSAERAAAAIDHPVFARLARRRQRRAGVVATLRDAIVSRGVVAECLELAWQTPLRDDEILDALAATTQLRAGDLADDRGPAKARAEARTAWLLAVAVFGVALFFLAFICYIDAASHKFATVHGWRFASWSEFAGGLFAIWTKLAVFALGVGALAAAATWLVALRARRRLWSKVVFITAGFLAAEPFAPGYFRARLQIMLRSMFWSALLFASFSAGGFILVESMFGGPYFASMWDDWGKALGPLGVLWIAWPGGWLAGLLLFAHWSPGETTPRRFALDYLALRRRIALGEEPL